MTDDGTAGPGAADRLRAENARLDAALFAAAKTFEPARLTEAPAGEWSAAQVLAHLGEFPRFFAAELRRWHDDPSAVIGRTMEHPVRLAAVESPAAALEELVAGMRAAFAELAGALEPLTDGDIDAKTENVKYGPEPLTAFFDRYVIGHKAGHLDQLRALAAGGRAPGDAARSSLATGADDSRPGPGPAA